MRASRFRGLALGSVLLLAVGGPARASAQVPLVPGGPWELFEWFLGVGPVEGPGFDVVSAADQIRVRVTDAGVSGDAFDVFINGTRFQTPSVPGSAFTGLYTGDAAWADPRLSHGEFLLAPGTYRITIGVRELAPGFDAGEGFIRADLVPFNGVVPEPASVLLLATGLAALPALAALARRRRPA